MIDIGIDCMLACVGIVIKCIIMIRWSGNKRDSPGLGGTLLVGL